MTNLKALLKFTHENINAEHWDMDADDYSEFMYLHEKAMGELGRMELMFTSDCPPDTPYGTCKHEGNNSETCNTCWRTYVDGGK